MTRIAVTGGSGRLGRSVVAGLRSAGQEVVSLDLRADPADPDSVAVDLRDSAAAQALLAGRGIEAVVHLAAIATPFSAPEPVILQTNTLLAHAVCSAAVAAGVGRVVVASSPTVHGYGSPAGWVPESLPLTEDSPLRPWNAYALSKCVAEQVAAMFAAQLGDRVRFACFRPCYVIAPEEWRGAPTQQGHTVAERLADPALSAPALFNYLDARDAAEFVDLLLAGMADLRNGQTFLVGADDALADRPLAELLPRFHPGTAAAAVTLTGTRPAFSNQLAGRLLGWHPRHHWRRELAAAPAPTAASAPTGEAGR